MAAVSLICIKPVYICIALISCCREILLHLRRCMTEMRHFNFHVNIIHRNI